MTGAQKKLLKRLQNINKERIQEFKFKYPNSDYREPFIIPAYLKEVYLNTFPAAMTSSRRVND